MAKIVVVLLSMVISQCLCNGPSTPEVRTDYGTYRGHLMKSRNGRDIFAFQGVPFAQPPVGELRFVEPVKLEKNYGVFDASKEGNDCFQIGLMDKFDPSKQNKSKYIGSEDCLYLNIYTPQLKPKNGLLPVYFYIHGGGFFAGSGSTAWNGPRYFLDRDVIMVMVNYRLSILGFLSANDENLPGNLGLKDQTMALKWVKENIEAFGGDPNSITLGGGSAGAVSVSHHINSKTSRGLFQRAISQSGTAEVSFGIKSTKEARQMASNIISFLGCPVQPEPLLKCLQEQPVEILFDAVENLKVPKTGMMMFMVPVAEKDSPTAFMTKESIREGSTVPWLSGVTDEEGLSFYQILVMEDTSYLNMEALKKNYKELLPTIAYYNTRPDADTITKQLKDFYFGNKEFSQDTSKNFVKLLSDRLFNHGLHLSAKKHKGKLYMYVISFKGTNTITPLRPKGMEDKVGHGDDMLYFIDVSFFPQEQITEKEIDFSNTVVEIWYNFIKHGDPTPDTQLWEESDGGKKYLDFTNDAPVMKTDFFKERMDFLDKLNIDSSRKIHDEL